MLLMPKIMLATAMSEVLDGGDALSFSRGLSPAICVVVLNLNLSQTFAALDSSRDALDHAFHLSVFWR